jgi:hypothetical protein
MATDTKNNIKFHVIKSLWFLVLIDWDGFLGGFGSLFVNPAITIKNFTKISPSYYLVAIAYTVILFSIHYSLQNPFETFFKWILFKFKWTFYLIFQFFNGVGFSLNGIIFFSYWTLNATELKNHIFCFSIVFPKDLYWVNCYVFQWKLY